MPPPATFRSSTSRWASSSRAARHCRALRPPLGHLLASTAPTLLATLAGHAGLGACGCVFHHEKRTPADRDGWRVQPARWLGSTVLHCRVFALALHPCTLTASAPWRPCPIRCLDFDGRHRLPSIHIFDETFASVTSSPSGKVATRTCPPSPPHPALFSTPDQLPSALAPERATLLCAGPPPFLVWLVTGQASSAASPKGRSGPNAGRVRSDMPCFVLLRDVVRAIVFTARPI